MGLALEKYMNFNKSGFKQLAAARQSVAITHSDEERRRGRQRESRGRKLSV